ncbi:MAG: WecB/TagA/CpsF family glycosyltransferase [Solirubrobacteraceae bacterium]|nr:WecB/TagA/CpsF family glycosyltransferase [Solirubrobacteraceae bacterium]
MSEPVTKVAVEPVADAHPVAPPPPFPTTPPSPVSGDTHRVDLLGMAIDRVTEEQTVGIVLNSLETGAGGWIITPNADHLRRFRKSPEIRDLFAQADLSVADGMPLVWASSLQNTPLPERVAGSNLIWTLSRAAGAAGRSVFLLGGDDGVAERAAEELRLDTPSLRIAGTHCPPVGFEDSSREMRDLRRVLVSARPDIVFVGLGFPKQEKLIAELRELMPATWFLGIGISLSFVSGDVPRAPEWMWAAGLEWLHRLITEPRRLFERYIRHGLPFVFGMLMRCGARGIRARLRRGHAGDLAPAEQPAA